MASRSSLSGYKGDEMIDLLNAVKDKLATIQGITTVKVGLEPNISPKSYPIIRIVPQRTTGQEYMRQKHSFFVYIGFKLQESQGIDTIYQTLYDVEKQVKELLVPEVIDASSHQYIVRFKESLNDEDKLKGFKVMVMSFEAEE